MCWWSREPALQIKGTRSQPHLGQPRVLPKQQPLKNKPPRSPQKERQVSKRVKQRATNLFTSNITSNVTYSHLISPKEGHPNETIIHSALTLCGSSEGQQHPEFPFCSQSRARSSDKAVQSRSRLCPKCLNMHIINTFIIINNNSDNNKLITLNLFIIYYF